MLSATYIDSSETCTGELSIIYTEFPITSILILSQIGFNVGSNWNFITYWVFLESDIPIWNNNVSRSVNISLSHWDERLLTAIDVITTSSDRETFDNKVEVGGKSTVLDTRLDGALDSFGTKSYF